MNTSINLTSQKISFVNKISILQKALSNDESPTPSYLYKEINDISFESVGYCESLVEFLVDRLRHPSCHVKLKVLKVMKHVLENGTKEFQLGLRHHVSFIKECTIMLMLVWVPTQQDLILKKICDEISKFSGPPHPVHGNTPYVIVRNIAVELCEMLYNLDPLSLKLADKSAEDAYPPQSKYGGMGPSRSGGAIQGFGNSPMSQSKGFAGTILHEIEKLGTKLSETPADRQSAVLVRLNLSGSSSNYQPPVISPESNEVFAHHESRDESPCLNQNINKAVPRHFPGKAGGGWNDDDDEENSLGDDNEDEQTLQIEKQSASTEREGSEEMISDEQLLIDSLVTQDPSVSAAVRKIDYLSNSDISQFLYRCAKLKCTIILDCICYNLSEGDNAFIIARSLHLLESIVYSPKELINIDNLAERCKSDLVDCFVTAGKQAAGIVSDEDKDSVGNWRSIQIKAAKLICILHKVSSYKDILPSSEILQALSRHSPSAIPVATV